MCNQNIVTFSFVVRLNRERSIVIALSITISIARWRGGRCGGEGGGGGGGGGGGLQGSTVEETTSLLIHADSCSYIFVCLVI